MAASVVLTGTLLFLSLASANPMCLWGFRDTEGNSFPVINGLYREGGEQANGKAYWKLDLTDSPSCGYTYCYIYWYDEDVSVTGWWVACTANSAFNFGLLNTVGRCTDANSTFDSPDDCGEWSFRNPFTGVLYVDSDVFVQSGRCPSLDCAEIFVSDGSSGNNIGCGSTNGDLYEQTGTNEYTVNKTGYGERVWWFNEVRFKWYCTTADAANSADLCRAFSSYTDGSFLTFSTLETWTDLSDGETLDFEVAASAVPTVAPGNTGYITCHGTGTTSTFAPTTPNPTLALIPTPMPTFAVLPTSEQPTISPTRSVTSIPTLNPTTEPTAEPIAEPTTSAPTQPIDDPNTGEGVSMKSGALLAFCLAHVVVVF